MMGRYQQYRRALLICPNPLMHTWARELKLWSPRCTFESFDGCTEQRRTTSLVSICPLKFINYESLTRDWALSADECVTFDIVVLDEA